MISRKGASSFAIVLAGNLFANDVQADVTPASCGLSGSLVSGVSIKACIDLDFDPIDVAIDPTTDRLYVSRYYDDADIDDYRMQVYDISDPSAPDLLADVSEYAGDSSFALGIVGLAAGDEMVFGAVDCAYSSCSDGGLTGIRAWNACETTEYSLEESTGLFGNYEWPAVVARRGMHTVSYYAGHGLVYGANNRIAGTFEDPNTAPAYRVPIIDVGWECPFMPPDPENAYVLQVTGLTSAASQIHEVSAYAGRLGVAAWTDAVLYDLFTDPVDPPRIASVTGNAVHTAWPVGEHFLVTEERVGGRYTRYGVEGYGVPPNVASLVPKQVYSLSPTAGASVHEVRSLGSYALLSAYQAGFRAFRLSSRLFEYGPAAYIDTSVDSCPTGGCSSDLSTWSGGSGVDAMIGADGSVLVAMSDRQPQTKSGKLFLLGLHRPEHCADGYSCVALSGTVRLNAGARSLVVARSSTAAGVETGKLIRYNDNAVNLGLPVSLTQGGLSNESRFGESIAHGDFVNNDAKVDVAVGAPGNGAHAGGQVFVYRANPTFFDGTPMIVEQETGAPPLGTSNVNDMFGMAVVSADFNNDLIPDLAVGAPRAVEGNVVGAGSVFLYRGTNTSLVPWAVLSNAITPHASDAFGIALAAGDFNGDGVADLAVGAPAGHATSSDPSSGFVSIYRGTANPAGQPTFWARINQGALDASEAGDEFGRSLAVGDFNGDGKRDLAVGAPGEITAGLGTGRVYVFLGNAASTLLPWLVVEQTILDASEEEDMFGRALASGDMNADGKWELVVSAPGEHLSGGSRAGKLYLFRATGTGFTGGSAHDQSGLDPNADLDGFGLRLIAGDLSKDGRSDIVALTPGLLGSTLPGATPHPALTFKAGAGGTASLSAWQALVLP